MKIPDNILNNPYIDKGAYKVPENYFENLNNRILQNTVLKDTRKVDNEKKKETKILSFISSRKFKYAAAACIAGITIITGTAYMHYNNNMMASNENSQQETISEQYVNDCMEYAMVDNYDIYNYIAEE